MSFLSRIFTPRGTGGQQAALKEQQKNIANANQMATEAYNATAPTRNVFSSFLSGSAPASSLPSWMQTSDAATTSSQVYNAFNNLGQRTAADLYNRNNGALAMSRLRRGIARGSSGDTSSLADLLDWYDTEKAKEQANALMQSLSAGANLRNEAGRNYMSALQYLSSPPGVGTAQNLASAYGNLAGQYGEMGRSQMADLSSLLNLAGKVFPNAFAK